MVKTTLAAVLVACGSLFSVALFAEGPDHRMVIPSVDHVAVSDSDVEGRWVWTDSPARRNPELVLHPGGRISGNDGLNELAGSWDRPAGSDMVTLNRLRATSYAGATAGSGAAAANIIGTATALVMDAGRLIATDARGRQLATLTKTP
jgi:heat shock protein HslJ